MYVPYGRASECGHHGDTVCFKRTIDDDDDLLYAYASLS